MKRKLRIIVLISLVLWASGCTAIQQFGSTSSPPATAHPPGIDPTGVQDPDRLLDAHFDQLDGRSYATVAVFRVEYPNGTVMAESRTRTRMAANRSRWTHDISWSGTVPSEPDLADRASIYVNGDRGHWLIETGGGTRVISGDVTSLGLSSRSRVFERRSTFKTVFSNVNRSSMDSSPPFRLRATVDRGERAPKLLQTGLDLAPQGEPQFTDDVTVVAHIDPSGLIRETCISWHHRGPTFPSREPTWTGTVRYCVEFVQVGDVNVRRPGWVRNAS